MKFSDLDQSIMEAQRFLGKAMVLRTAWKASKAVEPPQGATSAAVKRASMDLSKSLAALRRP